MKKILLLIFMTLLLVACSSNASSYEGLTRVEYVYEDSDEVKTLLQEKELEKLRDILEGIKWNEDAKEILSLANVELRLYMEEQGAVQSYRVLYENGGKATIINEETGNNGALSKSLTTDLKRLLK
ncbi:hypothetical protein [Solibacillus sp. FSL H8-0538]|uniref:hypothetical protein n=1 Tax=Solibacillus sp. FSL H8-0538 TaxID=2921400 RepID=UPI0030F87A19